MFPKGLVHGYWEKIMSFSIFCFNANGTRKTVAADSEQKEPFFDYEKHRF